MKINDESDQGKFEALMHLLLNLIKFEVRHKPCLSVFHVFNWAWNGRNICRGNTRVVV